MLAYVRWDGIDLVALAAVFVLGFVLGRRSKTQ